MSTYIDAPASPSHSGTAWLRIEHWLPWLVLAVSLLLTWQLWQNAKQNASQKLQSNFDSRAHEVDTLIKQRMMAYEQVLRGVNGLFASSKNVGRSEFRDFVSTLHLEKNFPGIQGVSFARVVPAAEKSKHIAAVREEGFPEYTIKPEGEREIYAPVVYIEPFTGLNLRVHGFDNYSNPERSAVVNMARDSSDAVISGKIKLMQETDKDIQAGCLMFLPVYKNGVPHDTLAQRRANIFGWVALSFRMNDLMRGILGERSAELDIEIFDGEEMSEQTLMYDDDNIWRAGNKSNARLFQSLNRVEIAGHFWTTTINSLPEFEAQLDKDSSQFIAYAGTGTSILLTLLTWLLVRGRASELQALQEVRAREEAMRLAATVFNTVDEAVIVTSQDNLIVTVNPAFTAITGYSADEVTGKNPRILSAGKHSSAFYREMWEALAATGVWQGEIWNRRKNGELYTEWLSIKVLRDEDGKISNHVAVFSDITERKQAEAALRESENRQRLLENQKLVQTSLDGFWVVRAKDGRIIEVNDAFCDMVGYAREELLTMRITDLEAVETPAETASHIKKIMETGYDRFETCQRHKRGHLVNCEISATYTAMNGGMFFVFVRDITERKQAERHLRELTSHIQTVREEEKARIAREIHDDLGSTLAALKLETYQLDRGLSAEQKTTPLFARVNSMISLLDNAIKTTRGIINDLRPTLLDDLGLMAALEWQCGQFHQRTGIECRVVCINRENNDCAECKVCKYKFDKMLSINLLRIFQEALTNVARHSGASRVEAEFRPGNSEVILSISDDGCGLPEGRTIAATSYGIRGMRERAEQFGGEIKFVCPPGGGLCVTARLPLPQEA
jgi:PAS domain S-box-containing protein